MHNATLKSYVIGFILSVVLTLIPYFLVANHILTGDDLLIIILGIAVLQFLVQLIFFLHLAKEKKPWWNTIILSSFVSIILIVVIASLWIMHHLNYNMSPTQMDTYMIKEEGMHK